MQDITPVDDIRQNPKCDREIAVYGYLRGTKLKGSARVHIAGVGDATVSPRSCPSNSHTALNTTALGVGPWGPMWVPAGDVGRVPPQM